MPAQRQAPPEPADADLKIVEITAYPTSYPLPKEAQTTMGNGHAIKRDAVIVKVVTAGGLVGWGESHHGRAHTAIAEIVNGTLKMLILGMDASDTIGVWQRIYKMQLSGHGCGAGTSMAMSGIDMALWDIKGKAVGWPLWKLLGGSRRPIPAYAGGVALGFGPPGPLVDDVAALVDRGYKAVKIRSGDNVKRDLERIAAVRKKFGPDLAILTDANTGYTLDDARHAMPRLDELDVGWLEEPFAAHDVRSYREAKRYGLVPLAAGENHYTRFEFNQLIEDGSITILQPDIAKSGGITECLRIAAMASAYKLPIHPHTAMSGLSMACSVHFLAAIDNAGYFEADAGKINLLRDELVQSPFTIRPDGGVLPLDKPGLGVEVNEDYLRRHPAIVGPSYV